MNNDGAGYLGDDVVFTGRQKRQKQTPQWFRDNGEAVGAAGYGISGNPHVTESSSVRIVFCFTAGYSGRCLLIPFEGN